MCMLDQRLWDVLAGPQHWMSSHAERSAVIVQVMVEVEGSVEWLYPSHIRQGRKRKASMGKKKIEIKKIEAKDARRVCFSQRKSGIFSKANQLATLCGAKVAILIESPAGCPFTFGSPSVGHVTDLFLHGGIGSTETDVYEAQRVSKVQQLNNNVMEIGSKIQDVKKKKAMLKCRIAELFAKNEDVRRIENVEDLNLVELKKIKESLERFKERIETKMLQDKTVSSGSPYSTVQSLSGNGIGQASSDANPFTTKQKANDEGPSDFKVSSAAMVIFPELGLRVNNAGQSHGKGFNMNLDPFEDGSYDHVEQMNPFVTPNAIDAGPSETRRVPDDNEGTFGVEKESK